MIRPNPQPLASIFDSATQVGKNIAIGLTVGAEEPGVIPGEVVGGRGSVVLVDPSNGKVLWQTYTPTDAQVSQGATGTGRETRGGHAAAGWRVSRLAPPVRPPRATGESAGRSGP
jgi:hypothetical protein